MAKPVVITADSTCDLPRELCERFSIRIIPLTITLNEESFPDDGRFTPDDMYRRFYEDGALPSTAAPSLQSYTDFFVSLLAGGCEIVHLTISSELSASYNAARLAAQELDGVYPVDSRMLSTGVALLAIEGAECAQRGMPAAEIAEHLTALTGKVETSFVLDTLDFMRKGGRCSGVAAIGANLLHIRPALEMKDGKLTVYKKYRGHIEQVYRQYVAERLGDKKIRPGHVFLLHSGEVAKSELDELESLVRDLSGARELHRARAGCTICAHCGPKTLAVMFIDE
ncbi:MAG: DegV family protein [Oscillospiraceae bacterium]|nr:DegV family protein [Oscillospiraceae bacterium]